MPTGKTSKPRITTVPQDDRAQADTTWVTFRIPRPPEEMVEFLRDIERLYRLNPHLDIERWQGPPAPLAAGQSFQLECLNEMTGLRADLRITVVHLKPGCGYTLAYDRGLKKALEVSIEPGTAGDSIVTLRERYHPIDGDRREEQSKEVDRGIVRWGVSIHDYLAGLSRWAWLPFYRWYKTRYWLAMTPRQRRIARLLILTTLLEFVVFLFVFVVYWLGKYL